MRNVITDATVIINAAGHTYLGLLYPVLSRLGTLPGQRLLWVQHRTCALNLLTGSNQDQFQALLF
jgi:hypothetical protein